MTYEYECKNSDCLNQWEAEQKITDEKLKICPKCGKENIIRLISGSNFILTGGGWAESGYSRK